MFRTNNTPCLIETEMKSKVNNALLNTYYIHQRYHNIFVNIILILVFIFGSIIFVYSVRKPPLSEKEKALRNQEHYHNIISKINQMQSDVFNQPRPPPRPISDIHTASVYR